MAKQVLFEREGESRIQEGMNTLADCVRITLGPTGKNIIYEQEFGDAPSSSGDSSAIADEVELENPFENIGAKLLNEVAENIDDDVGDGVATGVVLAEAIYKEGLKHVVADANPMKLRRGVRKSAEAAIESIRDQRSDIDLDSNELEQVATVAADGDEDIGEIVATAVREVGAEGIVSVEEGTAVRTYNEFVDGLNFEEGYLSPYFCTDREKKIAELDDAYVLIYEGELDQVQPLINLLEQVAQQGKPLLIIAEDVEGDALSALVLNRLRGTLKSCAVEAPAFGNRRTAILEDIAVLTGGQVISEEKGIDLENASIEHLGQVDTVRVDEDETVLTGGKGDQEAQEKRIKQIKNKIDNTDSDYDREKLESRLAKMKGGVARIYAGGTSESEIAEKQDVIESSVASCQRALQEGVVAGGGTAFVNARNAVDSLDLDGGEALGKKVVKQALEVPLRQISENAGVAGSVAVDEVAEGEEGHGLNAENGELEDLEEAGILDAATVLETALEQAASLSGTLLTANSFLADLDEQEEAIEHSMS